ncbi:MAG: M42 family metallopeptidase [Promethearchaeota archaeon]
MAKSKELDEEKAPKESKEERLKRIESLIDFELLRNLSEIRGCSGHEDAIREYIKNKISPYCDEIKTDSMGNLYGIKYGKNKNKSILLASHMDELGFIVRFIDKNGFLRVSRIGGQNLRVLPASKVIISSKNGEVPAIFGEKPIHLMKSKERETVSKFENLFLDIGVSSKKDAEEKVSIGDYAEFEQNLLRFPGTTVVSGKGFDDRIGCYVLISVLKQISEAVASSENELNQTVIACFTTQEEIGLRGAAIIGNVITPTSALVIEVTHSLDFPGINPEEFSELKLREGPSISVGPNLHPRICRTLIDLAKKYDIKFQIEPENAPTGTDARNIQVTGKGIPVGLISVPIRYMHTPIETLDLEDVVSTIDLVMKYILESKIDDFAF